jgi:hypothetical protein
MATVLINTRCPVCGCDKPKTQREDGQFRCDSCDCGSESFCYSQADLGSVTAGVAVSVSVTGVSATLNKR